ncbi:TadG family pilus assembly protein [Collimonas arenae]|nr:TadG family pilus assembly protein [Collimonas arenae]
MNAFLSQISERPLHHRRDGTGRARGSVAVMAAVFLTIIIILFSSIDIGYMFYMKRDLQKVADLAALAGAQQLVNTPSAGISTACTVSGQIVQAAIGNAQSNGFSISTSNTITPQCGLWDPVANASLAPSYWSGGATPNAVKVDAIRNVPGFFGLGKQIAAHAIASGTSPSAAFSLGTGLLSLCTASGSLSAQLVNGLLGSNVCLSLASYNGLVGAQVSLLQVLANLNINVGTVTQVANTQISLAQLVNASIQALSPAQAANINVADLLALTTGTLGGTMITIGDLLNLNAANGIAALDTQINVLDLLNVGTLQVANKSNFINTAATIPGVGGLSLKLIEPPQIAVGIGATATSAQLRLSLNANIPGLLSLPLYVDLAPGTATLNSLQCNAPQSATFSIQTGAAEVCLANGQTAGGAPFSCPDVSKPANQVNVISVLGIPTVSLGINASLTNPSGPLTMNAPFPNSVTVGSSLSSILGNIIQPGTFVFGGLLSLLNPVLSALGGVLNPILSLVGAALDSALSLLGIGIGQSTLKVSSISCGNVKLVY